MTTESITAKLCEEHSLTLEEYEKLIAQADPETKEKLKAEADRLKTEVYGRDVYVRGLIEISNICRNDCLYCGLRRSNKACERYRLSEEEIVSCTDTGYELGFRTFVLQGGEDSFFDDRILIDIIKEIKRRHGDCAVTLSLGERSRESYERLFEAGADRYLLREETADPIHYRKLHPDEMSFDNRMECLKALKDIGYQTGCGFMVGSPYQSPREIAEDLKFIERFKPDMCGIGPFIPHRDTPFGDRRAGSLELALYLISILRIISPSMLIPATTALGTLSPNGREQGILSGANVVMPNLSPVSVRKKYELYDNKICTGEESAECRGCLERRMESIGHRIVTDRGDRKKI
ncbi:MAG: [FeFe] hydrogenase H-cluster radical SAM maturase HydE [Lachnospiraceae bacterium]|nr:[FeFe] hydrogenase H-cluster radical SAM maturase HydE [Lachnospiraceae bacterium]